MQEKHLYEYAVIRLVPCVEREEFMNAGVILYCSAQRFLQMTYQIDETRLRSFSGKLSIKEMEERLRAFQKICLGGQSGGTIGRLPVASRFRWLTASRSTVVQSSPVHPGLCTDAGETLTALFGKLVLCLNQGG